MSTRLKGADNELQENMMTTKRCKHCVNCVKLRELNLLRMNPTSLSFVPRLKDFVNKHPCLNNASASKQEDTGEQA